MNLQTWPHPDVNRRDGSTGTTGPPARDRSRV